MANIAAKLTFFQRQQKSSNFLTTPHYSTTTIQPSNMLCAKCISIFQNIKKTPEGYHHETVDDLVKAAQLGCKICIYENKIRQDLSIGVGRHAAPEKLLLFYQFGFTFSRHDNVTVLHFKFKVHSEGNPAHLDFIGENMFHIHIHTSEIIPIPSNYRSMLKSAKKDLKTKPWHVRREVFHTREIQSNTGSEASMKVAEGWLRQCRENHKSCQNVYGDRRSGWYPKRLVAVGDNDNEICLAVPAEEKAIGVYAALSHCWGKDPSFLTLTSDNYEEFRNNIPVAEVPKSFRDAIYACRRLGIKYIWIDSLCIKQSGKGSETDWLHQAAEMEMIYLNCDLNLTIVHGSNPHDGAFMDRNPDFLQDCQIWAPVWPNISSSARTLPRGVKVWQRFRDRLRNSWEGVRIVGGRYLREHVTPEKLHWHVISASGLDSSERRRNQPLTSRGWVLQERLLSPRALHFQSDRIAWECQEAVRSEYFPSGLPCKCDFDFVPHPETTDTSDASYVFNISLEVVGKDSQQTKLKPKKAISTSQAVPSPRCKKHYWDLINDYTGRELSFPSKDKLVAFSAVAKQFSSSFGHSYMAGIFRQDLPHGLLWVGGQTCRQGQWRAPSWSWASVDGTVSPYIPWWRVDDDRTIDMLADVEDVNTELVDPSNPYGQVSSARLVLSALVFPWSIEQFKGRNNQDNTVEGQRSTDNAALEIVEIPARACSRGFGIERAPDADFEKRYLEPNYVTAQAEIEHPRYGPRFRTSWDSAIGLNRAQLEKCFLLSILETPGGWSWGLLLLRRDDGLYTRLGVYQHPKERIGLEAIKNGAEKQLITII